MLNNREWAILIWGVAISLILVARREVRSSVGQLLRIVALRHQAWGAASQSCGLVSLPPDAAMQ
jgi:hypothetical protein